MENNKLYVISNSSSYLEVIDTKSRVLERTIQLPNKPVALAIGKKYIYITSSAGIMPVRKTSLKLEPIIATNATAGALSIQVSPDEEMAYIGAASGMIDVVSLVVKKPVYTFSLGPAGIAAMALSLDGNWLCAAEDGDDLDFFVIDTKNLKLAYKRSLFFVAEDISSIAITPNSKTAYVVSSATANVIPINLKTGVVGSPVVVGENPKDIAIEEDGSYAYVTNLGDNTIMPIALPENEALAPLLLRGSCTKIALGAKLLVYDLAVTRKKINFLQGEGIINIIRWSSSATNIKEFLLFRNGRLLKTVPYISSVEVIDRLIKKKEQVTYKVVAVSYNNTASCPFIVHSFP